MTKRRKTGEKQRVRQPLKMDKLPQQLLDRVTRERSSGRTWAQLEAMSPTFEEWTTVAPQIRALFPGLRLPERTLLRWYDLRVEQVKREVIADQLRAREIAAIFAGKEFKDLPEAVRSALGDHIFGMMQHADEQSRQKVFTGLLALGQLLNKQKRVQIREQQVEIERRRVRILERELDIKRNAFEKATAKAARKVGRGFQLTTDDINRIRETVFGLAPVEQKLTATIQ